MSYTKILNNLLKNTLKTKEQTLSVPFDKNIIEQIFLNYTDAELVDEGEIWFTTNSGCDFDLKFNELEMTFNFNYDNYDDSYDDESLNDKKISKAEAYGADCNNMVYLGSGVSIPLDEVWW